jgi:hypothetical protein
MATSAAAVIAIARRRIASHFMSQNAVSAKDAVPFEPQRFAQRRQFDKMLDAGVIEDVGDGRYWMNVPAFDRWQGDRRKRVGLAAGALAVVVAAAALFA